MDTFAKEGDFVMVSLPQSLTQPEANDDPLLETSATVMLHLSIDRNHDLHRNREQFNSRLDSAASSSSQPDRGPLGTEASAPSSLQCDSCKSDSCKVDIVAGCRESGCRTTGSAAQLEAVPQAEPDALVRSQEENLRLKERIRELEAGPQEENHRLKNRIEELEALRADDADTIRRAQETILEQSCQLAACAMQIEAFKSDFDAERTDKLWYQKRLEDLQKS